MRAGLCSFEFDAMEPAGPQSVGRRMKGFYHYWEALSCSCAGPGK